MLSELQPVFLTMTCHRCGIQVVKQLMLKHDLSQPIKTNLLELAQDPFGNYIVHHYLENTSDQDRITEIAAIIKPKIMQLSLQKFSSTVVDVLLKRG